MMWLRCTPYYIFSNELFFKDLVSFVQQQAAIVKGQSKTIQEQSVTLKEQSMKNDQLSATVEKQSALIEVRILYYQNTLMLIHFNCHVVYCS